MSADTVDTMRSLYRQYGDSKTKYLRIVRVCWTKPLLGELPPSQPLVITSRTFLPDKEDGEFETQHNTLSKLRAWLRATGKATLTIFYG